jgi:hypothetical protein
VPAASPETDKAIAVPRPGRDTAISARTNYISVQNYVSAHWTTDHTKVAEPETPSVSVAVTVTV